jgi:hypothetical protein
MRFLTAVLSVLVGVIVLPAGVCGYYDLVTNASDYRFGKSVAAASGYDDYRKNRDIIKDVLTPSQLDRGQLMAREISERIKKRKAAKGE